MAVSAAEAASTAVGRLRAVREQARQRRDASRRAVEQLRGRNREESRLLTERAKVARRGQPPPWPDNSQPREMHLYDADDLEVSQAQPPAAPPPSAAQKPQRQAGQQPRPSDDDWSQESWLH